MQEFTFFYYLNIFMILAAITVFIILFFITAGYGQHRTKKWGFAINNKLAWVVMEIPTMLFILFFFMGKRTHEITAIVFLAIWLIHYIQRTFIFPLLIKGKDKMPITIVLMGITFNGLNAYIQARWINTFSDSSLYSIEWLHSPQFIIGVLIFFVGYYTNLKSDHILRNLRKPGDDSFHIPNGGMFKYVSGASYLGEMTEWLGWAILTWSLPGLIFFIWTFANLAPRAVANHKWYKKTFPDYPQKRKALIPFIW